MTAPLLFPGIRLAAPLLVEDWDDEAAIMAWLRAEKPEVVISPGTEWLHSMFVKRGLAVPEDLGLAGLACSHPGHECSGAYQDGRLIGATAIDALIAKVELF